MLMSTFLLEIATFLHTCYHWISCGAYVVHFASKISEFTVHCSVNIGMSPDHNQNSWEIALEKFIAMMWTFLRLLVSWLLLSENVLAQTYNNTGLTDVVEWDKYSLVVKKQRVFTFAGEFHYARLPVCESSNCEEWANQFDQVPILWLDIFQKFKANGLNSARY